MKYRDVLKVVAREAAQHLYSLECYDNYELADATMEQVDRAIEELQDRLEKIGKSKNTRPAF